LPELTVIYWRDIPAQVTATDGAASVRAALTDRFQVAIDEAAMQAGLIGSDEYLGEWRRESRECGSDLARAVNEEAARLEAAFTPEELQRLVSSGGRADRPAGSAGA
jgi:cvfA/B/C family virulence factor